MKKLLIILGIVLLTLTTVYSVTFYNTSISSIDNLTVINISGDYVINTSYVDINDSFVYFDNFSIEENGTKLSFWFNTTNYTDKVNVNITQNITAPQFVNTFSFYDVAGSIFINDLYFNGFYLNSSLYEFNIWGLYGGLGAKSWLFSKEGYEQEYFTVNSSTTIRLNETYNVTPTGIYLEVFSETDPSLQLDFNLTIYNSTNSTEFLNLAYFDLQYNETFTGFIGLEVSSTGYATRKFFTTFSPYTSINQTLYLLDENSSYPVIFRTTNLNGDIPLNDTYINFYRLIGGNNTFVGQALTDSQGFTYFNMDILADYELFIIKEGYQTVQMNSIPNKIEYNPILMAENDNDLDWIYEDVSYKFDSTSKMSDSTKSFDYNLIDTANQITNFTIKLQDQNYNVLNSSSSSSPNGGTLELTTSTNSSRYLYNLSLYRDGTYYEFLLWTSLDQDINTSVAGIGQTLADDDTTNAAKIFVIMLSYLAAAGFGAYFSRALGAVLGMVALVIFTFAAWIPIALTAIAGVITIGGVLYFRE